MSETIKKIRVSKKPKKNIMKIKRRKTTTHKIKIYCAKKFYEQYLEEHEKPIDFISKIKFDVCQIEHLFKYNPDCIPDETLTEILNNNVDLNMVLGIIFEHGQGKLKSLGIYESCIIIMEKLYYIMNKVVKGFGIDLKCDYSPDDLRFKLQVLKISGGQKRARMDRMIVMRDGIVIETASMVIPDPMLKGTTIMVEYNPNRFVNVPYIYYKKLYDLELISIHVQVAEEQEVREGESDMFLYLNKILESKDIYEHITNIIRYIGLWDTFDSLSVEHGSPYIPYMEVIKVKSKGKTKTFDVPHFITEYFDFL